MKAETEKTEVIQREDKVLESVFGFLANSRHRLDICASPLGPSTGTEFADALQAAKKRGARLRLLTEVTAENQKPLRGASRYLETRHVPGLRGNSWAVSDEEYVSSLSFGEFKPAFPLIHSNTHTLVAEHQSIFDALWSHGEPLETRLKAIQTGTDLPEVEMLRDPREIQELYLDLANRATERLLLLLPTSMAFRRDSEIGMVDVLDRKASQGVKVKLLTPVDPWVVSRLPSESPSPGTRTMAYRTIPPAGNDETVTLLVVDHYASLSIEEKAPQEPEFERAVGSALLATGEPRVRQSVRFFERLWSESELREAEATARTREETSRKRAELMQDILTHDIRNFNQVARLNAELLGEELKDRESTRRVSAIIRAVDGSTKLIERAKKLGSILSADRVDLHPVNLNGSFERSKSLVKRSNPWAKLSFDSDLRGSVMADELLDEVFVNIFSNAVKYTEGSKVRIELRQVPAELRRGPHEPRVPCWRISISDRGKGIPDQQKAGVFRRYLETAKGSGLGLSIVHALLTDRYHGAVSVKNRVEGDHTKGTTVDLWLPRA